MPADHVKAADDQPVRVVAFTGSEPMWLIGAAVVGVIAAWLAGRLMRGNGFGLIGDIIAGVLGAVGGGYVLHSAGVDLGGGLAGRLIIAFISAAIVLALVHVLTGRRGGKRSWS